MFLLVSFLALFARFRNRQLLLGSFQDDFFYYLKVAQNIASSGISTFDGTHLTNGYHPLWMAVLVVLRMLFHGTVFFVALQAVSLACAAFTYVLLLRILRLSLTDMAARAGAFVIGMEALMLIRYGMEVTLTLPLALLLIWLLLRDGAPKTLGQAAWLGFIASLMVLSRLDSAILLALVALAVFTVDRPWRPSGVAVAGFLCGLLPLLALYFVSNVHYFHLLTPASGLAKQMKASHMPSVTPWKSLLPDNRMRAIILLPELILLVAGLLLAFRRISGPRVLAWQRPILVALLLFPLVHLALFSMLSDWNVWPWYFYSITLSAAAAYVLVACLLHGQWTVRVAGAYGCVLILYALLYAIKGPNSTSILQSSQEVANYMDAHPGIYLMGDQAGTTAYLSHQPIVQAEGLVMDRDFLTRMRNGQPLRDVAFAYHARYYAVLGALDRDGCFYVAEPTNSGPASPKMMGTICHAPLATFYRQADHAPIRIFQADWIR